MFADRRELILDLLGQRQLGQAQYHLRKLVEEDPDDTASRSLLALCLLELEHLDEATEQARIAVEREPDSAYCHWVLGLVLAERGRWKQALPEAEAAVRLDPESADFLALLARIHLARDQRDQALRFTDRGLEDDPDHPECLNLRALVLHQAGRGYESEQAFVDAGALSPENAFARAGRGWAALQQGRAPDAALAHFHHALQIDPSSEWAREGLLAALKARSPVYRGMLRYFLWMNSLPPKVRLVVVAGLVAGIAGTWIGRWLASVVPAR